jgi:predicted house-cleaning noncanonical NTP pyrophosphatase (MazG superfamily)
MNIFNKLVRDNIPEIIKKENKIPKTRIKNLEIYLKLLILLLKPLILI